MLSRLKRRLLPATIWVASACYASAAPAAEVLFNFTGTNTATDGKHANSFQYSAGGINVRVSAWSTTAIGAGGTVFDSFLGRYGGKLGATSGDEDSINGRSGTHQIDNQNRWDFLIFQFDQVVELEKAFLTPYKLGSNTYVDADFTVASGLTGAAWNTQPDLNEKSYATLTSLFGGGFNTYSGNAQHTPQSGVGQSYLMNPNDKVGNIWLVGAAFKNKDGTAHYLDAFKLSKLTVKTAVPEPATWLMMIAGFGLMGGMIRRRRVLDASQPATA